jgi:hypothetical protein
MRIPSRTRSIGFRAVPWLAVLALAFAWTGQSLAQTAASKLDASKVPASTDKAKRKLSGNVWTGQTLAQTAAKPAAPNTPASIKKAESKESGNTSFSGGTLSISNGTGWQIPATLEQALKEAMENNPTIVTAKTKVTQAEADLNTKRMDVARRLVQSWAIYQQQKLQFEQAVAGKNQNPGGVKDAWIVENAGQMSVCEMELRSIIGQPMASAPRTGNTATATTFPRPPKPVHLPRGPVVEKIRKALLETTELDFTETPLSDFVDYVKERHKIEIQIDDGVVNVETPITFRLKGVSLGAALQAIDDRYENLKLVVRDYGILVTTPDRAVERGYFPVVDFARDVSGPDVSDDFRPTLNLTPAPPVPIMDDGPTNMPSRTEPLPTIRKSTPNAPEMTPSVKPLDEVPLKKSLPTPAEKKPAKEHDPFQ